LASSLKLAFGKTEGGQFGAAEYWRQDDCRLHLAWQIRRVEFVCVVDLFLRL